MVNNIFIPKGFLAVDDDPAKKKREELKKKLAEGKKVTISPNGQVNPNDNSGNNIQVPPGKLAVDDDPAKKKREELKKKLAEGKKVTISPNGQVNPNDNSGNNIQVPPGKLAFYWYEQNQQLINDEIAAMNRYFPSFELGKLDDGRLFWFGTITPKIIGDSEWALQLVYENNHPSNSTYGGSVKVYSIEPDLEELSSELGENIPHLLKDSKNNVYLCTARKEDVRVDTVVTSAASSLAWAVKWISIFELWLAGDVTTEEFQGHSF